MVVRHVVRFSQPRGGTLRLRDIGKIGAARRDVCSGRLALPARCRSGPVLTLASLLSTRLPLLLVPNGAWSAFASSVGPALWVCLAGGAIALAGGTLAALVTASDS